MECKLKLKQGVMFLLIELAVIKENLNTGKWEREM